MFIRLKYRITPDVFEWSNKILPTIFFEILQGRDRTFKKSQNNDF
jgi:hypothetical protein